MHNIVLQYALRKSGIKPVIKSQSEPLAADECNLQVMAPPDMPAGLAAKKIHGYIVAEPFNALGETKAGGRMLRFTGDIWKNHPCCVLCMHEEVTTKKPEWTQKVMNALVRAEIYASGHKTEVAKLLSKDGAGYLPLPAPIIERAMTYYDYSFYGPTKAIEHPDWKIGRIDFQPWPYPSATKLIVQGDERDGGQRRHDLPEEARSGLRRQGPGQLRLRSQRDEQISGVEEGSQRQSCRSVQPHGGAGAVTLDLAIDNRPAAPPRRSAAGRRMGGAARSTGFALVGIGVMLVVWWIGGLDRCLQSGDRELRRLCPSADFRAACGA